MVQRTCQMQPTYQVKKWEVGQGIDVDLEGRKVEDIYKNHGNQKGQGKGMIHLLWYLLLSH